MESHLKKLCSLSFWKIFKKVLWKINSCKFFWFFLWCYSNIKSDLNNCLMKNLVWLLSQKLAKWPRMRFFKFFKIVSQNWSDSLHKATVANKLEIDLHNFFGKNLVLRFFEPERDQWGFSSIIKGQYIDLFYFLHEVTVA